VKKSRGTRHFVCIETVTNSLSFVLSSYECFVLLDVRGFQFYAMHLRSGDSRKPCLHCLLNVSGTKESVLQIRARGLDPRRVLVQLLLVPQQLLSLLVVQDLPYVQCAQGKRKDASAQIDTNMTRTRGKGTQ
jgi:hypothetical protein